MRTNFRIALVALAWGLLPGAWAGEATTGRVLLQPPPDIIASPINDRFAVRVLGYYPAIDNRVRYDNSAGDLGTRIDIEDVLGQKRNALSGTIDMTFRILERHRIQADFYQLRRTGDEVIDQQIRFGEDVYDVNDRVLSESDLRKLGVTYTYSVLRRERFELGLGMGLHLLQVNGTVSVPAQFQGEQLDTAGPFAALAGQFTWRITRRLSLNASGQYFDLNPDEVHGAFRHYHGDLQWRVARNFAIGAGYSYSGYLVDSTDEDFSGFYRLVYKGPEVFVRVSF